MKTNNKEFKEMLDSKFQNMYDDNKISISDMDELRMYEKMYIKAFIFDNTISDFDTFEVYQIQRGNEFLEIDKDEYTMNEYACEICEWFFNKIHN